MTTNKISGNLIALFFNINVKLLNQDFQMVELKSSLRKFYGRHHELVDRYGITVSQMISDMFLTS